MIFPKVTRSLNEFWFRERRYGYKKVTDDTKGLCGLHTIWIKTLNPITLLHELIHYPIRKIHFKAMKFNTASIILFLDIITNLLDFINGILRYKFWRENIHECINILKFDVNAWLDWVLCREVI